MTGADGFPVRPAHRSLTARGVVKISQHFRCVRFMKQAAPSSIREVLSGRKTDRQQANGVNNEDYLRHPRHRHRACAGSPASAQEAAPSKPSRARASA
jgi:hypothetical protein